MFGRSATLGVLMPRVALVILVALSSGLAVAHAQPDGRADFRVGAQAFRANKFDVAARAFEQAYARDARPEIAFSIAQANRLQYYYDRIAWRLQRALQLYEVYLQALPSGPRAKDAIDHITEISPILEEVRRRGELVPYAAPVSTQIVVGAEVDEAEVTIDGRPASLWEAVDVTEGVHEVIVVAAGYEVARRKVPITAGRFVSVDVPLVEKPARLTIVAEEGARAYVDGRPVDADRELLVSPGSHFVSVTRRGRQPWSRALVLERDRGTKLVAPLVPTTQRKISSWVLLSGGVLGAATGTAALWGYAARRDAERLDDARRALGATPADLARYNQRVADVEFRDRLTLGLGVASVGVLGLGLAMWLFDHDPPDGDPRLDVQPAVVGDGGGVIVGGTF